MNSIPLSPAEKAALVVLAIFGALIPNGVFLYYFLTAPEVTQEALSNPISLVFISEAFLLMFVFAWLLRRYAIKRPGSIAFIVMSLLGSMVFSVPAALYLILRKSDKAK